MDESAWEHWLERSGDAALHQLAPEAAGLFETLSRSVALPPGPSASIRQAVASCMGLVPLGCSPLAVTTATETATETETLPGASEASVRFAEQFALDVSIIDDALRSEFLSDSGDSTFGTIQTIWTADMVPRVRSVLDHIFNPSDWKAADPVEVGDSELWTTVDDFIRVVHNLNGLDPVLSEVVRLRGAREHDCRLCKSLRSQSALAAGADEELFDSIDTDGQPGLSDRARTATALVDAFIWHPTSLPAELTARLRQQFEPAQAVELVLDIMRNAANKIAVALGADAPNVTHGIDIYDIDENGVAHYGLEAPQH
ncbi:MAG: hypothetical protein WBA45_16550 [Microthrixaceae bacterium]